MPRSSPSNKAVGRKRRIAVAAGALVVGLGVALFLFRGEDLIRAVTLPLKHEDIIRQQAQEKGVPADLIAAVIYNESRFRDQTSSAGARGLMQITPKTAQIIESKSGGSTFTLQDLSDPDLNIRYGTFYLKYLLDRFNGNEIAAIAAYNAGETVVEQWGGANLTQSDIKFPETRAYVDNVLAKRDDYRRSYRSELGL
ncbi:MAG: soluble lytic murein transglycosylase [Solirubrobacterales bacterium]|nr:soluble lytic murein transglycosylase [Solirubrobacterales bacterium]